MRKHFINKIVPVMLMLVMVFTSVSPAFAASGRNIKFSGHMAGTKGKMAYFAVGIDGGGPLYSYNSKTKSKKKLAGGKWAWLNVTDKYLILTKNKHGGSDGRNYYVYRMKKNGKSKKNLAKGFSPIVKGKYIYYIAVKKSKLWGQTVDNGTTGIYRMKFNGKGKRCILKAGKNVRLSNLGVTSSGLVFMKNGEWYSCSLKGKKVGAIDIEKYSSNINVTDPYGEYGEYSSLTSIKSGGGKYYVYSPGDIERREQDDGYIVATVKGTINKIIVSGSHIMAISRVYDEDDYYGMSEYYVYMMKTTGGGKKRVTHGVEVSGGWDY